ncbi:MAG: hypothetical protein QM777_15115 [Pseudorhodoferax sp.]
MLLESRFMGDPGVLIGKLYPDVLHIRPGAGNTIFIPHYRERFEHRSNRHYKVVSIDATPRTVAEEVCRAEFVYTSSFRMASDPGACAGATGIAGVPTDRAERVPAQVQGLFSFD